MAEGTEGVKVGTVIAVIGDDAEAPAAKPAPVAAVPAVAAPTADAVKLPVRTAEDLIPARAQPIPAAPSAVAVDAADEAAEAEERDDEEDMAPQAHDANDDAPYFDDVPDEAYLQDAAPAHPPAAQHEAAAHNGHHPAPAPASLIALPVQAHQVSEYDKPANTFGESLGRVPAEFVDTPEGSFWNDTVVRLIETEAITAVARQLALRSQLLRREPDCWWLQVDLESLAQAGTVERLRTALVTAGLVGKIEVSVGPVQDCPARRKAQAQHARQRTAEEVVRNDPYVQSLIQQFGAKIVPGSIQPL